MHQKTILKTWIVISTILFQLLMGGCSTTNLRRAELTKLEGPCPIEILKTEVDTLALADSPMNVVVDVSVEETNKNNLRRYSMVFDKAPLLQIIQSLISGTGLSLALEPEIVTNRPVTVTLFDVSLEESLDMAITGGAGYAWTITDNKLIVTRFEERIYHFDYLNLPAETTVEVGGDMLASGVEQSGVTGTFKVKTERKGEDGNIWTGISKALQGLKSEDGILEISKSAGIIYMEDTPKRVKAMVRLLDNISEMLHRQVFIEAKILEVRLSNTYKYGIDWSSLDLGIRNDSGNLATGSGFSVNSGSSIVLADEFRFNMVLDFLGNRGDVTVLSNPHISVMNGQPAIMTVGYQFPYGDITGVDRDPETGFITYGTSIKRAVLGLQLGLTPHISADGVITFHIVPTITRIQGYEDVDIPTSITTTQSVSNPVIDLQELATTVRVREGESIVLAGLISQMKQLNRNGLPLLASIPGIKQLLSHFEDVEESRELVIFITPYIKDL